MTLSAAQIGPCLYLCKLTMWLSFPGSLRVSGLPCLLHKVLGLLNTIAGVKEFLSAEGVTLKGHLIFSLFSTYVSWENLLRNASLINSIGGHNKAVGWGIGLAVAAQGRLTEPVKDKNYLLFLDFCSWIFRPLLPCKQTSTITFSTSFHSCAFLPSSLLTTSKICLFFVVFKKPLTFFLGRRSWTVWSLLCQ